MSIGSMSIHNVTSIKIKSVSSEKEATWRDLQIIGDGIVLTLTLFADDADNLRINLQEGADLRALY